MNAYYSTNLPQPSARRRRPKRARRYALLVAVAVVALLGAHFFVPHKGSAQSRVERPARTAAAQQEALTEMNNQINTVVVSQPGVDISVTVTNLRTKQSQSYGPAVPYEAASVAKLITAADFLHQTESGQQNPNEKLEDGNTAAYDLKQMVVVSDNNAWQSLTDQLTLDNLGTYSSSIGINDYDLNNNTLETSDIALLLQKLYDGQLLDKTSTNLLLGYMKIANEAGFIPPAVPRGVPVYHKAGVLEDRIHDAAIIDDPRSPVALVIFTNGHGTYDTATRTQAIQSITKAVLAGYDIK